MRSIDELLEHTTVTAERARKGLLHHVGKIIALLCLVIAATLTFADVTLMSAFGAQTLSTLAIMSVGAVLIYCSMQSEGESAGRECERYLSLQEEGRRLSGQVRGRMHDTLCKFLEHYLLADAEQRRRRYLSAYGISEATYGAYLAGEKPSKVHRRPLRRAKRIRPRDLPVGVLLASETQDDDALYCPTYKRGIRTLLRLLPSLLGMLITVSVMIEWKDGLTGEAIVEGVIKLSALLTVGLRGYADGYRYVSESLCAHLATKNRILDTFLLTEGASEQA